MFEPSTWPVQHPLWDTAATLQQLKETAIVNVAWVNSWFWP